MGRLWDRNKCSVVEKLKTANVTVVQRLRQAVKRDETQLGHIIQDLEENVEDFDFDPKSIEKLLKSVKQGNNMIKNMYFKKALRYITENRRNSRINARRLFWLSTAH